MNRSSLIAACCVCGVLLATTILSADEVVTFDPDAAAAASAKEPEKSGRVLRNLSDVQVIPLCSVMQDVEAIRRLKETLLERETLHAEAMKYLPQAALFMLVNEYPEAPSGRSPTFLYNGTMTRPVTSYYGDIVVPLFPEVLQELKTDEDIKQPEPDVYDANGMLIVVSDHHYAGSYGEDLSHTDEDIARLRRLIQHTESNPPQHAAVITTNPQTIGRSALKPELASVRARLLAEAQQRDDEQEFDSLTRGLWQQLQISAFDAFFNDTEQLNFTVNYDKSDQALIIELDAKCTKHSPLDQYIAEIGATRSRVLSYLHPNHVGFVSTTIPLSKEIASPLPRIAALVAEEIAQESGLTDAVTPGIEQTLQKIADDRRVECLVQTVATETDSTVCVIIAPLEYASALGAPLIQLVSGNTETLNTIGEIDGFPVTEIPGLKQQLSSISQTSDMQGMFVTTDQCVAVMFGTAKDLPLLENILQRDFDAPPAATQFRQSVFAAEAEFSSLATMDKNLLSNSMLLSSQQNKNDGSASPEGKIQVYVHTAPHQLTLTVRFEKDAMIAGVIFLETVIESLGGLYEYFVDE